MPVPQPMVRGRRTVQVVNMNGGIDLITPAASRVPGTLLDAVNFMAKPQGGGYERYSGYRVQVYNTDAAFLPDGFSIASRAQCFVIHGDLYYCRLVRSATTVQCQIFRVVGGNVSGEVEGQFVRPFAQVDSSTLFTPDSKRMVKCEVMVSNFSGDASKQRAYISCGGLMQPVVFDPDEDLSVVTVQWKGEDHLVAATPEQERDGNVEAREQDVKLATEKRDSAKGEKNHRKTLKGAVKTATAERDGIKEDINKEQNGTDSLQASLKNKQTQYSQALDATPADTALLESLRIQVTGLRESIKSRIEFMDQLRNRLDDANEVLRGKQEELDEYVSALQEAEEELGQAVDKRDAAVALGLSKAHAAIIQTFQQKQYPTHIARHADRLIFGFASGNVLLSSADSPVNFNTADLDTGLTGTALIFSVGQAITGMAGDFQGGIVIFSRNETSYLTGSSSADFVLRRLSSKSGAKPHTMQMLDSPICLDDRGLRSVEATQRHGDLLINTISESIQPIVDKLAITDHDPVASVVVRHKNQYRVFYDTGDVLVGTFTKGEVGTVVQWTRLILNHKVVSAVSYEDDDGKQVIYLTDEHGNIFRSDVGNCMPDDKPVVGYLQSSNITMGMPNHKKRVYRVEPITSSSGKGYFDTGYILDYATKYIRGHTFSVGGERRRFDRQNSLLGTGSFGTPQANWNKASVSFIMRNMSLVISTQNLVSDPFEISGFTVDYSVRGLDRSRT